MGGCRYTHWCPYGCGKTVTMTFERIGEKIVFKCHVCHGLWLGKGDLYKHLMEVGLR